MGIAKYISRYFLRRQLRRQSRGITDMQAKAVFQLSAAVERLGELSYILVDRTPSTAPLELDWPVTSSIGGPMSASEFQASSFFEVIPIRIELSDKVYEIHRSFPSEQCERLWNAAKDLLDLVYSKTGYEQDISYALHLLYISYYCILLQVAPDDRLARVNELVGNLGGKLKHAIDIQGNIEMNTKLLQQSIREECERLQQPRRSTSAVPKC